MIRDNLIDEYFTRQPQKLFQEDLKKNHVPRILSFDEKQDKDFVQVKGAHIVVNNFPLSGIETSINAFNDFLRVNGIDGQTFPIILVKNNFPTKEGFLINVIENSCTVSSYDKAGLRFALNFLEKQLIINGGKLKKGLTDGLLPIKHRITRCFFSPTNRPPLNGDELSDDVDYYPDAYLTRLMRSGINGIWIYSDFDALVNSSYITEYGKDSEKRIEKLNRVIKKCAKYGISVYLFVIEPSALTHPKKVSRHKGIVDKYPEVHGNTIEGEIAFCTYTEMGEKYCVEASRKIFELCPGLGGLMNITQGERITSCSTVWVTQEMSWGNNCPHCKDKSKVEILCHTIDVVREGIRQSKPEADYVSWTYEHRLWDNDSILEYVEKVPSDVVIMQNFEDNGRAYQLGKKRQAIDYWLSYTGPSDMFKLSAKRAKELGKEHWAKMQICCSHELASVPYIPVPGIIYDKICSAKGLGITGIMESWFFGNYPCLMSEGAYIASFNTGFKDKNEFLTCLAKLYWKIEDVENVVNAWNCFEKAYSNYPLNVMFSYYGPMHDGIVWKLQLKPKNFSLPRSWLLTDIPEGDRIGESLFNGHTINEVITLIEEMDRLWEKGCEFIDKTTEKDNLENEQITVIKAIRLLIKSCLNVLTFYKLRNDLGYGRGNELEILSKLKEIVQKEIINSKEMIPLCLADNRLGYHSEAEGFKFFPQKLQDRQEYLNELLNTEFNEVQKRIKDGLSPLEYFDGVEDGAKKYLAKDDISNATWCNLSDGKSRFKLAINDDSVVIWLNSSERTDFLIGTEYELNFPTSPVIIKADGKVKLQRDAIMLQSIFDERIQEEISKWKVEKIATEEGVNLLVTLDKSKVGFVRLPFKIMVKTMDGASWCTEPNPVHVLGKSKISPGEYGWVLSDKSDRKVIEQPKKSFNEIFSGAEYVSASRKLQSPYIRSSFNINSRKQVKNAKLYLSVLGFAELYINGKLVNDDLYISTYSQYNAQSKQDVNAFCENEDYFTDELSYTTYYYEYDVKELLNYGKNAIGILLAGGWYRTNKDKYGNFRNYGEVKTCFKLVVDYVDGSVETICSDKNCKWKESFLTESGVYHEEQDERLEIKDFSNANFNDDSWLSASLAKPPVTKYLPFGDCPKQRIMKQITPVIIKQTDDYKIFDVGENVTGYPIIICDVENGGEIHTYYSEVLDGEDLDDFHSYNQRSTFISDGRIEHSLRFTWHGFRYVKVLVKGDYSLLDVKTVNVVYADVKNTSQFNSNSEILNWIYDTYIRTQLENYQCGVPTDCPQIERKGYTGDGQLLCDLGMTLFDAKNLYKKWMIDIADAQDRKSGFVHYTAPCFVGCSGGPGGWGSAIINVPYQYFKVYGDKEILNKYYSNMLKYIEFLDDECIDGLVNNYQRKTRFLGDWAAPCNPEEYISNVFVNSCFYAYSLINLIEIARTINKPADVKLFQNKLNIVSKAIEKNFMDDKGNFCGNIKGANAFAIKAKLGDNRTAENLNAYYEKNSEFDTGIFGTRFVVEMLFENGYANTAFNLLVSKSKNSFYSWMKNGATTLYEAWGNPRSMNHPMFGGVVMSFYNYVLGIKQKDGSCAFSDIEISPSDITKLTKASGGLKTEKGDIKVSFEKNGSKNYFTVEIPKGVNAVFKYKNVFKELICGKNTIIC